MRSLPTSFRNDFRWFLAIVALGAAGGWIATSLSIVLALGAAAAVVSLVVATVSPSARLLTVTVGALAVFQAPGDSAKIAYLGLLGVCVAVALINLFRSDEKIVRAFLPMFAGGTVFGLLVLGSFFVSRSFGIASIDWLRDSLGYVLLVALPIVGLEAAQRISIRWISTSLAILGSVAAIGFALDWLNRRGVADTGGRIVLATVTFTSLAFVFAAVRALSGPHRLVWALTTGLIAGALLVTGSRTQVLVLLVGLAAVVGSPRKARVPARRVVVLAAGLVIAAVLVLPIIGGEFLTQTDFLSGRFDTLVSSASGGLAQDQSFLARTQSYSAAQYRWGQHPWFGGGPGYAYYGIPSNYSLDTPWMLPAKFGLLGTIAFVVYMASIVRSASLVRVDFEWTSTVARGWTFVVIALIPFGAWFEDKGTGLALMFIVVMLAASARDGAEKQGSTVRSEEAFV